MKTVIAIDGPAASGKSSVAKRLAASLGFSIVNSGAFYRIVTWRVLQDGIDASIPEKVIESVAAADFSAGFTGNEARFLVDGRDCFEFITEDSVNRNVSYVARVPAVRDLVTGSLRDLGCERDIIIEGRDIGSVVFPETPYKFYIDASPEVRAQRRAAEGQQDDLAARDKTDSSRKVAPLTIPQDAVVIDSTCLTIDGVVDAIAERLRQRGLAVPTS